MSNPRRGTIVELDPMDGLGWILLDDGERVRFGGTACQGFEVPPGVGTRVLVTETTLDFRGVTKARSVRPAGPGVGSSNGETEQVSPAIPWPRFVETHPRWSDVEQVCLTPSSAPPLLQLSRHPVFSPWHQEICAAPILAGLEVPHYLRQAPVEPEPTMSFAHGETAFLESPNWPVCGACGVPLEMCLQLAPGVMTPWIPGCDRGLVVLFCFHCGIRRCTDPQVAHIGFVEPKLRVARPTGSPPSASSGHMPRSQLVKLSPPRRLAPSANWYTFRSEVTPGTASSELFLGRLALAGPLPSGMESSAGEDIEAEYEDWLGELPGASYGGGQLGGHPCWDQADATPICDGHGEMAQLLEYSGGQFLDGALHLFICRTCSALRFVAEF